jgi:hypothetical protein
VRGRIRSIKPDVHLDEKLWDAEEKSGLPLFRVFTGLWNYADREGRFEWRPRALKSVIMPYWNGDISNALEALHEAGLAIKYEVDGKLFGYLPNFNKHQAINKNEARSVIPEPPNVSSRACTEAHVQESDGSPGRTAAFTDVQVRENEAYSLPFPSLKKTVLAKDRPKRDPLADQLSSGGGPRFRADVRRLHERFKLAIGLPGLSLDVNGDFDAQTLADALDAHGPNACDVVADESPHDRMVTGEADERGNEHKSVGYVFGKPHVFARILAAGKKRLADERKVRRGGPSAIERALSADVSEDA